MAGKYVFPARKARDQLGVHTYCTFDPTINRRHLSSPIPPNKKQAKLRPQQVLRKIITQTKKNVKTHIKYLSPTRNPKLRK
jgi:hypothetical protein